MDAFPMSLETAEDIQVNGRVAKSRSFLIMDEVPDASGKIVKPVPVSWKRCVFEILYNSGH
jgi:hypothetical protein